MAAIDIDQLVQTLATRLVKLGGRVATAESCTGGMIASNFVALAGSSEWFEEGFVTYSNQAKQRSIGVDEKLIMQFGAVSTQVVEAMANGAAKSAQVDYAVATSGIAGPGGGTPDKPVGTVCIAAYANGSVVSIVETYRGDRAAVREQASRQAILLLLEQL